MIERPEFSRRRRRRRHPLFTPCWPISLPWSEGIKVTECNHCPLSANEQNGEGRYPPPAVFGVSLIELSLHRKRRITSRGELWEPSAGGGDHVMRREGGDWSPVTMAAGGGGRGPLVVGCWT